MEYTIEHEQPYAVCVVRVTGEHKRPGDSIVLQEVARKIRSETGCKRFLYDMRKANITCNTMDTYVTGIYPAEKQFEYDFRIALVYSGRMVDHYFMENVVGNRGYTLRVFSDIEWATSWLSEDAMTT